MPKKGDYVDLISSFDSQIETVVDLVKMGTGFALVAPPRFGKSIILEDAERRLGNLAIFFTMPAGLMLGKGSIPMFIDGSKPKGKLGWSDEFAITSLRGMLGRANGKKVVVVLDNAHLLKQDDLFDIVEMILDEGLIPAITGSHSILSEKKIDQVLWLLGGEESIVELTSLQVDASMEALETRTNGETARVARLSKGHPFYLNALAHKVELGCETADVAWDEVVNVMADRLLMEAGSLTGNQRLVLFELAVSTGTLNVQGHEFCQKVEMSPSSVARVIDALVSRSLVWKTEKGWNIVDPAFEFLIRRSYGFNVPI